MTSKVRHRSVLQGTGRDCPRGVFVSRSPTPGGVAEAGEAAPSGASGEPRGASSAQPRTTLVCQGDLP